MSERMKDVLAQRELVIREPTVLTTPPTKSSTTLLRNAQVINAMVTEVSKTRPEVERLAKHGAHNLHISTPEDQVASMTRASTTALSATIAETQMVPRTFGATLLTQRRDGKTVIH